MLQIIRDGTVIPFMRIRLPVEVLCLAAVAAAVVMMAVRGLNWGLDFTGGIVAELRFSQAMDLEDVRGAFAAQGLEGVVQHFGSPRDVVLRVAPHEQLQAEEVTARAMEAARGLDDQAVLTRSEFLGPAVGEELVESGVIAIAVSLLAILAYIAFRFEWRMATGAVISLAYDVIIVLGVFAWLQIEYDLSTLAALLTVVGYSLNDKIVVFDRVRENATRLSRALRMDELFDVSLSQTLSRTLITSGTTLVTSVALLIFGGEMIYGFALALTIGVVFGTFSSIYVASTWALMLGIERSHLLPLPVEVKESDGVESMD